MNKKLYIQPKTLVINIHATNLCLVSNGSADMYSTTKTGASGALSRGRDNSWDEEDDY